jgi:hypothetical protein
MNTVPLKSGYHVVLDLVLIGVAKTPKPV